MKACDVHFASRFQSFIVFALLFYWTAPPVVFSATAQDEEPFSSFSDQIRPIFNEHCIACHGGVKQASGLSLIYRESALREADSGATAIVPGDPDKSSLIERISDTDPDFRMPPVAHGPALSVREIALIRKWIEEGAPWEEHWSFTPPKHALVPTVAATDWCLSPIDHFIAAKMSTEGLTPSPASDKAAWLRRVTFDLIGLPPTRMEIEHFESDESPAAFERVVDRLLASPSYGERWASLWLDLSRYADTMGYEKDIHRDAWPYRDWLIRSLNADMPFDEFTIKQLAGDLLENPSIDDRIATTFHRNTQTNTEGGTDDEEFRVSAVIDRVNTTWQVWQATTFGCTQCHAHPYDPIEHADYYRFMAFFNTSRDCDVDEEYPKVSVPLAGVDRQTASQLDRRISRIRQQLHEQFLPFEADAVQWQPLHLSDAQSTGQTQLMIRPQDAGLPNELFASGTLSAGSKYTIKAPIPEELTKITALRIEVSPKNPEEARRNPEMGFVLTRLRIYLQKSDHEQPIELRLQAVRGDEAEPIFNPHDSLCDNRNGWGDYPRLSKERHATFILESPIEVTPNDELLIYMEQERTATGEIALVVQRGLFFLSQSDQWNKVVSSATYTELCDELSSLLYQRQSFPHVDVPIMVEQSEGLRRETYVFERGNWLDKNQRVEAGVPTIMPSLPRDAPLNRLTMARWLVSKENPLTARVMVNRAWEQLFGTGIVETAEDFGSSGTPPTHPELLDYLALRFQEELNWSFKQLLREIVLSATYRQDSSVSPELAATDPRNRWLARGPRQRLSAEMIRDQALALSGLISYKMFGRPVMPWQPEGVWRSVYSGQTWNPSKGEDQYRRAVYTYWKRTSGYPSLLAFDAPSREVCSLRRTGTNTPLQALVTLNDLVFVECAQAFAQRMLFEGGKTLEDQIEWGLQLATGRSSHPRTLGYLQDLYKQAIEHYRGDNTETQDLGSDAEHFAMTMVGNAILNLDEVLSK
jgi:mono/diheme cytochrome c family protein